MCLYKGPRRLSLSLTAMTLCLLSLFATKVSAQTLAEETTPDIKTVLKRLEAAEAKIRELEKQPQGSPLFAPPPAPEKADDEKKTDTGKQPEAEKKSEEETAEEETADEATKKKEAEEKKKKQEEKLSSYFDTVDDLKLARDAEAAAAKKKPTFKIGGRVHFDTTWFPEASDGIGFFENPATGVDPETRIFFRRIRLEMGGDIFDTMLWRMQIDFNSPDTPEYKDVYVGFKNLPLNHTILIGNQKRPLGLDHLNSSRFNVFMERPLVVEAFNEDARRTGIAAYAYTDELDYTFRYGLYSLENTTLDGEYLGDSLQYSGNARISGNPWYDEGSDGRGYFHWAVSGMVARPDGDVDPNDTNANESRFRTRGELRSNRRWIDTGRIAGAEWYEIAGLEAIFNYGPLQITSEFQSTWMQRDNTTPGTGPDLNFHGAYVYAHYMLTGEHIPYNRQTSCINRLKPFQNFFLVDRLCNGDCVAAGWGAWGIGARLSYLDLTDKDIRGGREDNLTLGLNWWWTAYSKIQFNLVHGNIEQHRPVGGFTDGHFWGFTTRVQADF